MDEQSLLVRQGGHTTNRIPQQMNSNRSSNQGQGKAKGKNRPKNTQPKKSGKSDLMGGKAYAPVAQSRKTKSSRPREAMVNGVRTLTFKEYVQDVVATTAFASVKFPVQPGISTLFAWLATQATSYQEYAFSRLKFCFETEVATTQGGKVMYAFQQDATDPLPASKQELLENEFKATGAVWQAFTLEVPVNEALGKKRYIRSGALAANLDLKTYDLGNLIVATQGIDTDLVSFAGELYVEYTISLFTPVINAHSVALAQSLRIDPSAGVAVAAPFGTTRDVVGGLDIAIADAGLEFNRVGEYRVQYSIGGTGLHTLFAPVVTGTEGATITAQPNDGISNAAANAGTAAMGDLDVTIARRGGVLSFDFSTMATTITSSSFVITILGAL